MTPSEFEPPKKDSFLVEAKRLISNETNPLMKAKMMVLAIGEGMPSSATELLDTISEISDDDERSWQTVSPYQEKGYIMAKAIETFAAQQCYDDVMFLLGTVKLHDTALYLKSVNHLLKTGYTGPNDELLHLSVDEIKDLVTFNPDGLRRTGSMDEERKQQFHLETYLESVAYTGVDIADPEAEWSEILIEIATIGDRINEKPWQQQRRLRYYGRAYAEAGYINAAIEWKNGIADDELRASLCVDIVTNTSDSELVDALSSEVDILAAKTPNNNKPNVFQFNTFPSRADSGLDDISRRRLKLTAKKGAEESRAILQLIGAPEFYNREDQMELYLEIYKTAGDPEARKYCLELIGEIGYNTFEEIKEVAIADYKWGNVLPSPEHDGEVVPVVVWEVERVHWGIEKYLRQALGEDTSEMNFTKKSNPEEQYTETMQVVGLQANPVDDTTFGRLSAAFGEGAIQADLEACQADRDEAFFTLAKLLAANGSNETAGYLLNKIDGPDQKTRCLVALGMINRLAR